jgi:hypothetical protein
MKMKESREKTMASEKLPGLLIEIMKRISTYLEETKYERDTTGNSVR